MKERRRTSTLRQTAILVLASDSIISVTRFECAQKAERNQPPTSGENGSFGSHRGRWTIFQVGRVHDASRLRV